MLFCIAFLVNIKMTPLTSFRLVFSWYILPILLLFHYPYIFMSLWYIAYCYNLLFSPRQQSLSVNHYFVYFIHIFELSSLYFNLSHLFEAYFLLSFGQLPSHFFALNTYFLFPLHYLGYYLLFFLFVMNILDTIQCIFNNLPNITILYWIHNVQSSPKLHSFCPG